MDKAQLLQSFALILMMTHVVIRKLPAEAYKSAAPLTETPLTIVHSRLSNRANDFANAENNMAADKAA